MTSIKAFVEGMRDGVAATLEMWQEYLQIIKQKTDEINGLMSQIFLYSKMGMDNYPFSSESLDIGSEITDFAAAVQDEYMAKGVNIVADDIPAGRQAYADPSQLRSVFANIFDNIAKYKDKDIIYAWVRCTVKAVRFKLFLKITGRMCRRRSSPNFLRCFIAVTRSIRNIFKQFELRDTDLQYKISADQCL